MAYYNPRNPPENVQYEPPAKRPKLRPTVWDIMKAPLAGFWQGLAPRTLGGNLNFEEYMRKKRLRQRLPRLRAASRNLNWLERIIQDE